MCRKVNLTEQAVFQCGASSEGWTYKMHRN